MLATNHLKNTIEKVSEPQDVIIVRNVNKKFHKTADQDWWKKLLALGNKKSQQDSQTNGNGKNCHQKKTINAVDDVSFVIRKGEIFGVLGPNGSGKSTLIRVIATLLLPDDGSVSVFGYDVEKDSMQVQNLINRVSVEASFFKKLSPMENLLYGARLYGINGKDTKTKIEEILTRLGLEKRSIFSPMEEMSRGMQQKVAIARALLTQPKVLLLDEPTTGLDPRSKREVQAVVRELQEIDGTTILLTTHDMLEADTLCQRIAIMDKGKVVAMDTPNNLKKLVPSTNGTPPTLEDVFIELTGRKLKEEESE
ncbi:MAG: ABC transporter ATP-binding protein [Anaerolineales bacterium]|nr:ABC transporter ATP-binding protein [Anaerolineales bacterium]